ncbi:MAG: hypothetical protein CMH82_12665 [Nocardioides sp.]|nr:hypothetical protein [Nocardioides sp.]|tara:strand:- start:3092 stop:3643 length:552 start_codon:yes stop_codon:yes gene_type:complete
MKIRPPLNSSKAAVDLPSIMVGVVVTGIVGGVIGATVLAVIPWAQQEGVEAQLREISSAAAAYEAQCGAGALDDDWAPTWCAGERFGDWDQLTASGLFDIGRVTTATRPYELVVCPTRDWFVITYDANTPTPEKVTFIGDGTPAVLVHDIATVEEATDLNAPGSLPSVLCSGSDAAQDGYLRN